MDRPHNRLASHQANLADLQPVYRQRSQLAVLLESQPGHRVVFLALLRLASLLSSRQAHLLKTRPANLQVSRQVSQLNSRAGNLLVHLPGILLKAPSPPRQGFPHVFHRQFPRVIPHGNRLASHLLSPVVNPLCALLATQLGRQPRNLSVHPVGHLQSNPLLNLAHLRRGSHPLCPVVIPRRFHRDSLAIYPQVSPVFNLLQSRLISQLACRLMSRQVIPPADQVVNPLVSQLVNPHPHQPISPRQYRPVNQLSNLVVSRLISRQVLQPVGPAVNPVSFQRGSLPVSLQGTPV